LQQIDSDNALRGFLEHDVSLFRGVAHFISSGQPGYARNSLLASEEEQIKNRIRDVDAINSNLEEAFDEADRIRDELRRRGKTF
jgi:cysteinyl-tRNA synthetase